MEIGGGGMGTVVFEYDISKALKSKYTSRVFKKIDGATVALEIDDKVMTALEESKDRDLAAAKIVERAQKICKVAADELAVRLAELEHNLEGKDKDEQHKLIKGFRAEVVKKLEGLKAKLKVLPEDQWKKFLTKYSEAKKEYLKYKVNAVVDVTVGTLGVAASAAALAGTAHTGGASLVLGVIGMTRSVAKISQVVYSLAVDVEKQGNALKEDLESLLKQFADSKGKATGKDLAKTTVNAVFGAPFFTTVSTASKKAETFGGKVAGTYVGGVKLSREVTASLNAMKKLEGDLSKLKGKDLKKTEAKLEKLQGNFDKLFEKAANLNAKAERVERDLNTVKAVLTELKDETKTLAYLEKALTILTSVGLAAASAGVGIHEAAGDALELAKEGITLAGEVLENAKEALEG